MTEFKETYLELLKKSLSSKSKSLDYKWEQYSLGGIKRGQECVSILKEWASYSIKDKMTLVVGCGTGGEAIAFAQSGAEVAAIDVNPGAIEITSVRAAENRVKIELKREDICKTSFSSSSFDLVVLYDVFQHLTKPQEAVREISRILKPGGKVFLNPANRFSPINILEDPCYHLFGVAALPYKWAYYYVVKVRKLVDEFEQFRMPTLSYLYRLFSKYGIKMANISLDWKIRQFVKKLDNPELIISPKKRRLLILLLSLKMKYPILWFGKFFLRSSVGFMQGQYLLGTKEETLFYKVAKTTKGDEEF